MPSANGCGSSCRSATGVVAGGGITGRGSTGSCTGCGLGCSGGICPSGSDRGRRSRNATGCGRPTAPGSAYCNGASRGRRRRRSADGCCRPLPLLVTGGQRADCRVSSYRTGQAPHQARQPHPGQGLQQRPVPPVPAPQGHPAHHPGKDRQPGRPPTQGLTRRTATRLRRRAVQEAQHLERAIDRLKQARAVATRYDKQARHRRPPSVRRRTVTLARTAGAAAACLLPQGRRGFPWTGSPADAAKRLRRHKVGVAVDARTPPRNSISPYVRSRRW